MKEDRVNLLSLVALLISTAGFKAELSAVRLGESGFTLFHVFVVASILFGAILYLHLFINGWGLLAQAWRATQRSWLTVVLRALFVLALAVIPLGSFYITSANWLYKEVCFESNSAPFEPFALQGDGPTQTVCQSPFLGLVVPFLGATVITGIVVLAARREDRKYDKLPPEIRQYDAELFELGMLQAVSSDLEQIRRAGQRIDELQLKRAKALEKSK